MQRAKVAMLSVLCVLLLLAPPNADAALLAIDLGSDFIKAALVKPGRAPVSIVLNEMSKRKTPAQVAFVDGERLLGDEAAAVAARYPERVLIGARDLLGRYANDTGVAALLQRRALPYTVIPDPVRGTVRFQVDKDTSYSVEEVVVRCTGCTWLVLVCFLVKHTWGRAAHKLVHIPRRCASSPPATHREAFCIMHASLQLKQQRASMWWTAPSRSLHIGGNISGRPSMMPRSWQDSMCWGWSTHMQQQRCSMALNVISLIKQSRWCCMTLGLAVWRYAMWGWGAVGGDVLL